MLAYRIFSLSVIAFAMLKSAGTSAFVVPLARCSGIGQQPCRCVGRSRGSTDSQAEPTSTNISEAEDNHSHSVLCSTCAEKGRVFKDEDSFFVTEVDGLAAVFDGHGGKEVSKFLSEKLYPKLQNFLAEEAQSSGFISEHKYIDAMKAAIKSADDEVQSNPFWQFQGSTATIVKINHGADSHGMPQQERKIVVSHVGDSRAVLCKNKSAIQLTRDHTPNIVDEQLRIESLGGNVTWSGDFTKDGEIVLGTGTWRLNGVLGVSRAIGDRSEKPYVVSEPETVLRSVEENQDKFIILATDGLWGVIENQCAVDLVLSFQDEGYEPKEIASLLVKEALREAKKKRIHDNVTVIIIWL